MKKTYKQICAAMGLAGLLAFNAGAQISGTVTINSLQGTGGTNYQTFGALASALNTSGVNGPLVVNVVANTGPYNEQPTFNQVTGMNGTNRVKINGNGNILQFNSTNSAAPWTMLLNGTDYLTVDNLNIIGQGATYAMVVVLTNGADNNKFTKCTMQCPVNGTSSYHVPFTISSSATSLSGGSNSGNWNTVSTSTLQNGYYGAYIYGLTGAPYQTNNTMSDCWVTDFYYCGVFFPYQKYFTLKNCTVDRLTRTSSTTTYGLMGYYQQGSVIDGNKIYKLFQSNQGTTSACYPMYTYYTSVSGGPRNTVRNNIITDIKCNGSIYGIYCYYMNADIYNNTIDLDWTAGSNSSTIYGMYPYGTAGYNNSVTNNIITIRMGGAGTRYGLYIAVTGNIVVDKNDIYVNSPTGSNYIGYYTSAATTIAQWQSQGMDVNGFSVDPMYANQAANDVHPTNAVINNQATPMGLVFDQEKAIRNQATPDIGALEFLTPACSGAPGTNAVTTPTFMICPGEDVAMGLANLNPATGFTYQWGSSTISNVGPFAAIPGATGLFYTAPAVTANTFFQVVMTCTLPGGGTSNYVGQVQVAGPTSSVVPAYEDFENVGLPNRLPNCSWSASGLGNQNQTSATSNSGNRVPHGGTSFGYFDNSSPGTSYFYTNPIAMNSGITYSAAVWYATEYFGYNNWTNLSIMVGPNQNPTGMVQVASVGPAITGPYKLLNNTFTVATTGTYYVAIRATSAAGSAQYLMIDDLSITIPCDPMLGSNPNPNAPQMQLSTSATTVCAGQPVSLVATGADTYSWSTGATVPNIVDNPTTIGTVNYTVFGTNVITGCVATMVQQVVVTPAPNVFIVANKPVVCAGEQVILSAYGANTYAWSNGGNNQFITVTPNSTTSYTVIGINSFGCSSNFVQNIVVNPNPNITVISSIPGEACKDDMITFSANGASTYQWVSSVSSIVYQGQAINVVTPASAVYTVMGTNANGCVGKNTISQNISDCTGLSKYSAQSGISVYPNPTSGVFTIETNSAFVKTIEVTDIAGRVIAAQNTTDTTVSININGLAAGIYYVKVKSTVASDVVKVVKQ